MKCWKCHTTMIKDEYSRTATCPCCGRTVHYRTKSEKRGYSYSSGGSGGYSGDGVAVGYLGIDLWRRLLVFSWWSYKLHFQYCLDNREVHF